MGKKTKIFFVSVVLIIYLICMFPVKNFIPVSADNSETVFMETSNNISFMDNESNTSDESNGETKTAQEKKPDFIKWMEFNVTSDLLSYALKSNPRNMCEFLAYVTLKNGNIFNNKSHDMKNLKAVISDPKLLNKYSTNKYFLYYTECYHAILDGIIGEYHINTDGDKVFGLKGYHPIAKSFWISSYDDFGNARGYGYKRRHLGHDLFGGTGTPIIAVEDGIITELGWNRFGGWRIGIRSSDTTQQYLTEEDTNETADTPDVPYKTPARYYYYAHLRKDRPFAEGLKKGDKVTAGQVIGYLGSTGYSRKENVNMKNTKPHLHFGIQIIFDPSQEDGPGEIWIDCYHLCNFLSKNRMKVIKNPETKEYQSTFENDELQDTEEQISRRNFMFNQPFSL